MILGRERIAYVFGGFALGETKSHYLCNTYNLVFDSAALMRIAHVHVLFNYVLHFVKCVHLVSSREVLERTRQLSPFKRRCELSIY